MLLFELLSRLQNSNTSLLFWNLFSRLKVLNELTIKSLSQNSQYHSATVSLFNLLMVNTHALHRLSLWSNDRHRSATHRSFRHASPHLWNKLPLSLRIPHSFEHTGLTCYKLLSFSITFSLFYSELKTYQFRKSWFDLIYHSNQTVEFLGILTPVAAVVKIRMLRTIFWVYGWRSDLCSRETDPVVIQRRWQRRLNNFQTMWP